MVKLPTLFLLICVVALRKSNALTEEEHKQLHDIMMPAISECSEQHGTKPEDLAEAKKNKDIDAVDSCFIECVLKKLDVMDDGGAFVTEKYVENMRKVLKKEEDAEKIEKSAKNCASVIESKPTEKCAKSKALLACLMEQKDLMGM